MDTVVLLSNVIHFTNAIIKNAMPNGENRYEISSSIKYEQIGHIWLKLFYLSCRYRQYFRLFWHWLALCFTKWHKLVTFNAKKNPQLSMQINPWRILIFIAFQRRIFNYYRTIVKTSAKLSIDWNQNVLKKTEKNILKFSACMWLEFKLEVYLLILFAASYRFCLKFWALDVLIFMLSKFMMLKL